MTTGRFLRIAGCAIAAAAAVIAVLPFRTTLPIHGAIVLPSARLRSSCGPPIANAWHTERTRYLSFSATNPQVPSGVGCVKPARDRLGVSAGGLVLALLLVIVARFIDHRPGSEGGRTAPAD